MGVPGLWEESNVRLLVAEGRERVGISSDERERMPPVEDGLMLASCNNCRVELLSL